MKKIIALILMISSMSVFAKCDEIELKGKIECHEAKDLSVVAVEDNVNGLGVYLFKGKEQVHKSFGFGEYANTMNIEGKDLKLVLKEIDGTFLVFLRGFNSDSLNNQEDGLFFNKINFETQRIVSVHIKFKSGEESDFVSVPTKSKVKIKDKSIQFDKVKIEYDGAFFREK